METKQKYQRPQSNAICFNCGNTFKKDSSEIRRNAKLGRENFCSRKCSANINIKNLGEYVGNPDNSKHLKGYSNNRVDEYTGLREHLNRVKNGGRGKEYNITLEDLKIQWEAQDGICPYTGVALIQPRDMNGESLIYMASLDRVDSDLGYVVGNIQFISASANFAKNKLTHTEMIEFCRLICDKWC